MQNTVNGPSPSGLLSQGAIGWLAYKQQKFIFHSAGGWTSEIEVPAGSDPGDVGHASGSQTAIVS